MRARSGQYATGDRLVAAVLLVWTVLMAGKFIL
jgi:hypothetical protein